MSNYFLSFRDESVLQLLQNIDQYCEYLKVISEFGLQAPPCLYNEHILMKSYCKKKWYDSFPSFEFVYDKLVQRKKLFSVPVDDLHYLYFHLLNTYNEMSKTENLNFIDEDTFIPYNDVSLYITINKMQAKEFFKKYLNVDDLSNDFEKFHNRNIKKVTENADQKPED